MEVLPIGSDIDLAYVTPNATQGRTQLSVLLNQGIANGATLPAGGTIIGNGATLSGAVISGGSLIGTLVGVGGTIIDAVLSVIQIQNSTFDAKDAIATAGSTQATSTVAAMLTNVTTASAGTGIGMEASFVGAFNFIANNGASPFTLYPNKGVTGTINGQSGTVGVSVPVGGMTMVFNSAAQKALAFGFGETKIGFTTDNTAATHTLAASTFYAGSEMSTVEMTGSIAAGTALTLPTVAQLLAAAPWANLNTGTILRVANASAGSGGWTLTSNGSFVTAGSSVVAQNTWADFNVFFNNATSATAQYLGHGTY